MILLCNVFLRYVSCLHVVSEEKVLAFVNFMLNLTSILDFTNPLYIFPYIEQSNSSLLVCQKMLVRCPLRAPDFFCPNFTLCFQRIQLDFLDITLNDSVFDIIR